MSNHKNRTQVAGEVAMRARVFARRTGQPITEDSLWEAATVMGLEPGDFTLSTAKKIVREELALMGESHLVGF